MCLGHIKMAVNILQVRRLRAARHKSHIPELEVKPELDLILTAFLLWFKASKKYVDQLCILNTISLDQVWPSLIHFACIGVAPPWLEESRGSNPNAGKMDQTWFTISSWRFVIWVDLTKQQIEDSDELIIAIPSHSRVAVFIRNPSLHWHVNPPSTFTQLVVTSSQVSVPSMHSLIS